MAHARFFQCDGQKSEVETICKYYGLKSFVGLLPRSTRLASFRILFLSWHCKLTTFLFNSAITVSTCLQLPN